MSKVPDKQLHMKIKINIVLFLMLIVGFGILIVRLYYIQIVDGEFYKSKALTAQLRPTTISADRGDIYDRNFKKLATSATVWNVTISPAEIDGDENLEKIADFLAPLLDIEKEKVIERGQLKGSYYEILKERIDDDIADQITQFTIDEKIRGINLVENTRRYYQYGDLASTVLGFTDNDNKGAYGIESHYNSILAGTPGMVVSPKNGRSGDMPFDYDKMFEPVDGNSLVLTIDEVVQHSTDSHIETAVIEHNVQNRGVAIVMDVNTGAVLAMTTKPDFDPNNPSILEDPLAAGRMAEYITNEEFLATLDAISDPKEKEAALAAGKQTALQEEWYAQWRNKAISDPYEPGSVFKILTASMALDLGVVKPTGENFYCPGYAVVAGRTKGCWKTTGHGDLDFTHAVMGSCNPVFMAMGARIGPANFYEYFDRFGLRDPTGIDLPGEAEGIFYDIKTLSKESGEELASSAFGQTFTITPLQLITAVSATVNGGKLMQPYVVSQIIDPHGNVVSTTEPTLQRQVTSEETSKELAKILELTVSDQLLGSGKKAYIPGFRIGGKTGTSEKLDMKEDGRTTKRISSFLGFAPAEDPQVAVLVLLDEPDMENVYGSVIAAPIVGAIMSDILPYLGIEPEYTAAESAITEVVVPYLLGELIHEGIGELTLRGLKYEISGDGVTVTRSLPSYGETVPKGSKVILYTDEEVETSIIEVPDVVGMTAQQANRTILSEGLNIRMPKDYEQNEIVMTQDPPAGTEVEKSSVITVFFDIVKEEDTIQPIQ